MSATWTTIARKDIEDAMRSKVLAGLTVTFVTFLVIAMLSAEHLVRGVDTVTATIALAGVAELAQLFIPGLAIVAGYLAVTGEHESGSLKLLLTHPFTRADIVAGKLAGRLAVTLIALLTGFGVASVLVGLLYGTPAASSLMGFIGTGVLLGATFVGLAVGNSAAATSRGRAMALTVGPYIAMVFLWKPISVGVYYLITGARPTLEVAGWYLLLLRLNPLEAYRVVTGAVLDQPVNAVPYLPLEDLPAGRMAAELDTASRIAGDVPIYLHESSAVVILLAWGLIPLVIGYHRFADGDVY